VTQVTRSQKVRLGIFLAAGLTVLIGGLAVLAGMKLGERRDSYPIRWRDVAVSLSGLDVGSPVKYSGIRVGRVDSVRIDPKDVGIILVEISLDHGTPIAEDTKANLGSQGITGLKYIELTRGSSRARVRKPGEEIPAGTSLFDTLAAQAGDIARKVDTVLDRVSDLTGPDMKQRIATLLDKTNELLTTVNGVLADNREALATLANRLQGTSTQVEALATELAGTAKRANGLLDATTVLVKNARLTPLRLNALLEEGTSVLSSSRAVLGPEGAQRTLTQVNAILAQSRRDIVEIIDLMRETAENFNALSAKLKDDPTLLLRREDEGDSQ
jgi:phospholipid/cholesterol/gamma-HCH transport system substrate-binding protein